MTTTSDLTKLTVNLVPPAVTALHSAAVLTGDTETDTVNRALQVYAELVRLRVTEGYGDLVLDKPHPRWPFFRRLVRLSWDVVAEGNPR